MNKEDLKIVYKVYHPRKYQTIEMVDRLGQPYSLSSFEQFCYTPLFAKQMEFITYEQIQKNREHIVLHEIPNTPCYVIKQEYSDDITYEVRDITHELYDNILKVDYLTRNLNLVGVLDTIDIKKSYKAESNLKFELAAVINIEFDIMVAKSNQQILSLLGEQIKKFEFYLTKCNQCIRNKKLDTLMELINE